VPGVELCTIHPETLKLLPEHEVGEVCVRGPNVFHGYIGKQKSPFIEINKKSWYRTGDLGHLDKNNNLILSGRLKRFVKMGGEMVSLGAVEEVFQKGLKNKGKPSIAIIPNEKGERTTLTLFTSSEITVQRANTLLKSAGFSRLVKIAAVKKLSSIPLTGTGKIDYRKLESQL
jgi:long-chain-fatty-acid--[acyl-carrier-protein] ligase